MGCDSKAIISKVVSVEDIVKYLESNYTNVRVGIMYKGVFDYKGSSHGFIHFKDGDDERELWVSIDPHTSYTDSYDDFDDIEVRRCYDNPHTGFSLGYWGNSVNILEGIVKYFGTGYVQNNDCGDDFESAYRRIGEVPMTLTQIRQLLGKNIVIVEE